MTAHQPTSDQTVAAGLRGVYSCRFESWQQSVPRLLDACRLGEIAAKHETVLIKPNLVETLPPPITTPVALVEEILVYLRDFLPGHRIIIGEGCGATSYDTHHAFDELGYTKLSAKYQTSLIDLNVEPLSYKSHPELKRWPEMYLPEILDRVMLVSVPQLKAHSLSGVTLSMKNMMGCAPPLHYRGGGAWNKASFHTNIQEAIYDLNRYRTPDFTLVDATIGMAQAHLWGPQCSPPVDRLLASFDPVAVDSHGTSLLQINWRDIGHIAMADSILGNAEGAPLYSV